MSEKKNFKLLSNRRCINCNQPLKQNLVDSHPDALRCWVCYQISIGRTRNNVKELKRKQRKLIFKWKG